MTEKTFKDYDEDIKNFIEEAPLIRDMRDNLLIKLDVTEEEMMRACYEFDKLVCDFVKKGSAILATDLVNAINEINTTVKMKIYLAVKALEIIKERKELEKFDELLRRMKGGH